MFIVVVLLYDESIKISKKFIQNLVCAIFSMKMKFELGAQWMRNIVETWYHCLDN